MKKYRLLKNDTQDWLGHTLFRIQAKVAFGLVEKGEKGGYIEKEDNLDVSGDAWVSGNACVSGDARVYGDAWVYGNARVSGNACVSGDARVYGDVWVSGNAWVSGRFDVSVNCDFDMKRIMIDTDAKMQKLKKFLDTF